MTEERSAFLTATRWQETGKQIYKLPEVVKDLLSYNRLTWNIDYFPLKPLTAGRAG